MRSIFTILLSIGSIFVQPVMGWPAVLEIGDGADCLLQPREVNVLTGGEVVLSLSGPFEDPVIVLLDSDGQLIWKRVILEKGGSSRAFESGGYLAPVADGFAVTLHSEPRATGVDTDVAVVRMNLDGDVLWEHVLGLEDTLNWMCTGILACSDGGFFISGCPGTMIPGGYAFKLDSEGEQVWITPQDVMEGYLTSPVELPGGDFLCIFQDYSGTLSIQRISSDGEIGELVEVRSDGFMEADGLHHVDGTLWISSMPGGGFISAFRLDHQLQTDRAISTVFPSGVAVRSVEMNERGMLVSGTCDQDGYLAIVGFDGSILWQDTVDAGGTETLDGAVFTSDGRAIVSYGTIQDNYGQTLSAIVDVRDVPEFIN